MKRRAGSIVLETPQDLDFTVLSFSVSDPAVRKTLGLNTKECEWKVQCRDAPPLDIKLHVDKNITGKTEVRITCNEDVIYPVGNFGQKSRLVEDFMQTWPFRGVAKGINEAHFVELRLLDAGQEVWFPGTIRKQRSDGFFEVLATKPDMSGGCREELYPFVSKKDLRVAASKQPYEAPERHLDLFVPAQDPLNGTTLCIDSGELITQYFGRPTPNKEWAAKAPKVVMSVTKDRSQVSANVGHRELLQYWNGEAQAVEVIPKLPGKLVGYGSKAWKIRVGLAEHTIEVERKHKGSKAVTLTVDGEVLIEALAEEIGCHDGSWMATFRFLGEPSLEFEVYETDACGTAMDSLGRVVQKKPYSRVCVVHVQDLQNLSMSNFFVDGTDFKELASHYVTHAEPNVSMTPTAMASQYHITVPYKVNKEAAKNAMPSMASLIGLGNGSGSSSQAGGMFSWLSICCCKPMVDGELPPNAAALSTGGLSKQQSSDVLFLPPAEGATFQNRILQVLASTLEMVGLIEYGPQKDVHEDAFSARGRTENNLRLILWLAAPGLMSIRS